MEQKSTQQSSNLWKLAFLCVAAIAILTFNAMTSIKGDPPPGYHRVEISQEAALAAAAGGNNLPNEYEKDEAAPATAQSKPMTVAK